MDLVKHRWGRIVRPANLAGAYLLIEQETREDGYPPPPAGSLRLRVRRPGAPDDHLDNYTVWITAETVPDRFGPEGFEVAEWLPDGQEPTWDQPGA